MRWNVEKRTDLIPVVSAIIILLIGVLFFHNDVGIMGNFVILSALVGILPYILISYFEHQKIKAIEDTFPIFLQDLAESQKSGMTLQDALKNASKMDYGKLTPEIVKMSNQLSWGISLQEVLERFSERLKKSELIKKCVRIIIEAYNSGGNIAETMEAIANDVSLIKEAEKNRKSLMVQHVMMMYVIYFVFIGIVIGLSKTMIPMIELGKEAPVGTLGFQDPCKACLSGKHPFCIACYVFSLISDVFSLGGGAEGYYRALFFSMILIQGIFTGIVCGQIGENSAMAGVKHSLIMTSVGFGLFMILFRLGFM
jgi:flagellar protein FlaJ